MRIKVVSVIILLVISAILIMPSNVRAGYSLAISGGSAFTAPPFIAKVIDHNTTYSRIYLS